MFRRLALALSGAISGAVVGAMIWVVLVLLGLTYAYLFVEDSPRDTLIFANWAGAIVMSALVIGGLFLVPLRAEAPPQDSPRSFTARWGRIFLIWFATVLVIVGLGAAFSTECRAVLVGLLRREPFAAYRPLSLWVARLEAPHPQDRSEAIVMIRDIGPAAESVAPAVLKIEVPRLSEKNPQARAEALLALRALGSAAGPAAPEVFKLINDNNRDVRVNALRTLAVIGPAAGPAAGDIALLPRTLPGQPTLLLVAVGLTAKELSQKLKEANQESSNWSYNALRKIGPPAASGALPHLKVLAASDVPDVANAAIETLGKLGPASIPILEEGLKGKRATECVRALGNVGPEAVPVLARVAATTANPVSLRSTALLALANLGSQAADSKATLVECLGDKDPEVRLSAALGLWNLEHQPSQVTPVLTDVEPLLKHTASGQLVEVLGELGEPARGTAPKLQEKLKDYKRTDGLVLAKTLVKLDPELVRQQAVPLLLPLLAEPADPERGKRIGAAEQRDAIRKMGVFGPLAAAAVPHLVILLYGTEKADQKIIVEALGEMGPSAAFAVEPLRELYFDQEAADRPPTLNALKQIAPLSAFWVSWKPYLLGLLLFVGLLCLSVLLASLASRGRVSQSMEQKQAESISGEPGQSQEEAPAETGEPAHEAPGDNAPLPS
jgi:HEAT repeat protein